MQLETLIKAEQEVTSRKFGTFTGVFMPTLLTILGAILYLRTGWVVGNAGLLGAFAIIGLSTLITLTTALSIASIATNIRVQAGGAFSIISQSLGLEVGGSISVPFYIAQSISVAFYIFAFSEGWLRIFPDHPEPIVIFAAFGAAFAISYISARLASRTQFLILIIQTIALTSVFLGSFGLGESPGFSQEPVLWGDFSEGSFWVIFAVFFPAVTGILAGVNMSGNLKNPRRSIPVGTLSAVLLSSLVYFAVSYWFSRMATPEDLIANFTIMVDRAAFGPVILAGVLAATFSAAMTSMVGAPRILQAISENRVLPSSDSLAALAPNGEPRNALYVTALITFTTLVVGQLTGGLNAIAPFMTMFFLITYAVLNGVILLEQSLGLISFRPKFRIPRLIPLIGLVGCLCTMFLINPIFSPIALVIIVAFYAFLSRRMLPNPFGDVRSGLFVSLAEWAAMRVAHLPDTQERAWKPNLLVPVRTTDELVGSYRFLKALTYPRGSVHVLGIYPPDSDTEVEGTRDLVAAFSRDGIFSRVALLEDDDFAQGIRLGLETLSSAFFRPNALYLNVHENTDEEILRSVLQRAKERKTGAILYAAHPITSLGREQTINVWIRDQSPSWEVSMRLSRLDLSLLLAYQITQNWHGNINLITVVHDPAQQHAGREFLNNLISVGRMPNGTKAIVEVGSFRDYLPNAPRADLQIFGMDRQVSLPFIWEVVNCNRASCIFVQDSGVESALA